MKAQYFRAMDAIHQACLFVAGSCLVIIVLIIPYGVFCRYVLNSAASWPEPVAILLMIILSFLSAVVCYRSVADSTIRIVEEFLQLCGQLWRQARQPGLVQQTDVDHLHQVHSILVSKGIEFHLHERWQRRHLKFDGRFHIRGGCYVFRPHLLVGKENVH